MVRKEDLTTGALYAFRRIGEKPCVGRLHLKTPSGGWMVIPNGDWVHCYEDEILSPAFDPNDILKEML